MRCTSIPEVYGPLRGTGRASASSLRGRKREGKCESSVNSVRMLASVCPEGAQYLRTTPTVPVQYRSLTGPSATASSVRLRLL